MHEVSPDEGVPQVIEDEATRRGFARTSLARREIPAPPGRALRFSCGEAVAIPDRLAPCPPCGGARLLATGRDAKKIKDLEVA